MNDKDANTRRADGLGKQQHDGRGAKDERNSKRPRDSKYNSSHRDSRAMTLYHAVEWRKLNPDIWASWEAAAKDAAKHKRRFSMQYVVEQTRAKDRVDRSGEALKISNNYCPVFARMIATEHPEVRMYIELRRSAWDDDYPEAFQLK